MTTKAAYNFFSLKKKNDSFLSFQFEQKLMITIIMMMMIIIIIIKIMMKTLVVV